MFSTPFTYLKSSVSIPSLPAGYSFYVDASIADSYPGTGTTWFDLSGNGYDMTINNANRFVNNGGNDKYMNFDNGISKYLPGGNLTDIPTTDSAEGTWVAYTSLKDSTADYRTLLRGFGNSNHPVITDVNTLSAYVNPPGTFVSSGFDVTTIPNYTTEPHMMAWKFKTGSTPASEFFYDSFISSSQGTTNTLPDTNWAVASIGAYHIESSSPTDFNQPWGKIWFIVYYPFHLTTAQLQEVNDYIDYRYN